MRILALVTDAFGGYGGIAQYNRDLIGALAAVNSVSKVEVLPRIAPEGARAALPAKVRQHAPLNGRIAYTAAALARAATRPNLIINGHLYHSALSQLTARVAGAPMVSVLHGTEIWDPIPRRHLVPLQASNLVLCVSADTESRFVEEAPALKGRTALTYNTVGDEFRPGDRAAARARFNLAEEFAILTVARLDVRAYKGHDRIISLLRSLPVGERPVVYLIAGVGEDEARLRTLAAAAGVVERVRFLGKVPAKDLPDLYRAADLFALPSTGEGFGIVYLEAMGCGTPAIGLAVGGAPDALGRGALGTIARPDGFAQALFAAIEPAAAMDESARAELSQRVHARFGRATFYARISEVLERLERC